MSSSPAAMYEVNGPTEPLVVLEVARRILMTDSIVMLTLVSIDGSALPPASAGAHVELRLASGLRRQYSLTDADTQNGYSIAVLRDGTGRGGSIEVFDQLTVGDRVTATPPRNNFELQPAENYLFIAGGIGVTPILAMVREAERTGARWSLHYGGACLGSMAFLDELRAIGGDRVSLVPQDPDGLMDIPRILADASTGTRVYCCGPAGLLDAVQAANSRSGHRLHYERFSAGGADSQLAADADELSSFVVELRQSGAVIDIGPGQSILDAVREVVPDAPYSCGEGYCGSCETRVLAGTPSHRDDILTPELRESATTMMICVSRSRTDRLVLDL